MKSLTKFLVGLFLCASALLADGSITIDSGTLTHSSSGFEFNSRVELPGLEVQNGSSPQSTSSTPAGEMWMTNGTPDAGKSLNTLHYFNGTEWHEFDDSASRQLVFADNLNPTDPEPTGTSWVTIDLSKDNAPTDAIGAEIVWWAQDTASTNTIQVRPDSSFNESAFVVQGSSGSNGLGQGTVWFSPGTQSFEARWVNAPTIGANNMAVISWVTEGSYRSSFQNVVWFDDPQDATSLDIATSQTAWTDVDLSSIIPVGAEAVFLRKLSQTSSSLPGYAVRRNGASGGGQVFSLSVAGITATADFTVKVDSSRVYEALWSANWSASEVTDNLYVLGYTMRTASNANRFFLLDDPCQLSTEWIGNSQTSYADVTPRNDCSDVPANATGVRILSNLYNTGGVSTYLQARKKGSSATAGVVKSGVGVSSNGSYAVLVEWSVALDASGTFEAAYGGAISGVSTAYVVGYYE